MIYDIYTNLELNIQSLLPRFICSFIISGRALFAPASAVAHCLLLLSCLIHATIAMDYHMSPILTTHDILAYFELIL